MGVPILGSPDPLEFVDGSFVSQKIRQIIDAIREYDRHINVQWIPPAARRPGQAAYRITWEPPGREPEILFHVRRDEDFTIEVLQRIIAADQKVNGSPIDRLEALEQAAKAVQKQQQLDAMEEADDIARHVLRSPLHKYKVNDQLTIDSSIPFNANHLKD